MDMISFLRKLLEHSGKCIRATHRWGGGKDFSHLDCVDHEAAGSKLKLMGKVIQEEVCSTGQSRWVNS